MCSQLKIDENFLRMPVRCSFTHAGVLLSLIPDSRLKYPDEDGSCHLYVFRCHLLVH